MKSIRWQLIIILVAGLLVGALLLSGQSGFRLISPAPAKGGSYTEALIGGLQRLNPLLDYYNQPDRDVDSLIFSSLLRFDSRGLPQVDLAEKWGVSMDGLVYNFDIQPKAVWHDSTPVTSADVVFTVEKMRDPASVLPEDLKTFWKSVEVVALSEKSFQFRLTEPFAPFKDYLTFGILPKHLLGTFSYNDIVNASFNIQPIGSGPYRFEKLIIENGEIQGVVLHANESFYGQVPFISQMAFRYYPDSQAALTAYQQGNVQGIGEVNLDILPQVLSNTNLSVFSGRKPEVAMVLFNLNNTQVKYFQEKTVRRALLTGLNRRTIINQVYNGQGIIASVPLLPDTWAYYDGLIPVDYDSQRAIDLLKQDGYVLANAGETVLQKNGTALSFELLYPQDDIHQAIAEAIQADWAKIGVEANLKPVSYDLLVLDHLQPLNYEAALVDLNFLNSPDPDPYPFWDLSQKSGGQNYSQWENRIASEYLEQARVSQDFEERAKLYRNFQVIFADELPALPLFYPIYNYGVDKSIQGIRMGPLFDPSDRFFNVNNWFLVSKSGK
jgi:peptide/nickel transport system substrate-binding protein